MGILLAADQTSTNQYKWDACEAVTVLGQKIN
jgi:hypothetical protein